MENNDCKYEINGKTYVQKPLVLGQINQLIDVMKGMTIPYDIDAAGIIILMGNSLSAALAVILTEEGKSPKDKDMEAMGEEFNNHISLDVASRAVEDFFDLNLLTSVLGRLKRMSEKMRTQINSGFTTSPVSSQGAILQNETKSSGDIQSETVNLTSNTEAGT